MHKLATTTVLVLIAALGTIGTGSTATAASAPTFANCDALHRVYPHGVGLPGARDRTSGTPVTSFKRSRALYRANKKSDRDKDGVACEQR
ncbi:excalibur calcium-binding domain-containing protein [Nocardioides pacificus]